MRSIEFGEHGKAFPLLRVRGSADNFWSRTLVDGVQERLLDGRNP